MEDVNFRSRSYSQGTNQIDLSYPCSRPSSSNPSALPHGLRCSSASYASASSYGAQPDTQMEVPREVCFKKAKSTGLSSISSNGWGLIDPELQRKKRVAGYRVYSLEGKVKGSVRKSFRWLKDRYYHVVNGWR